MSYYCMRLKSGKADKDKGAWSKNVMLAVGLMAAT